MIIYMNTVRSVIILISCGVLPPMISFKEFKSFYSKLYPFTLLDENITVQK